MAEEEKANAFNDYDMLLQAWQNWENSEPFQVAVNSESFHHDDCNYEELEVKSFQGSYYPSSFNC